MQEISRAPVSAKDRTKLKRDLDNIPAIAKRRNLDVDAADARNERYTGSAYFELGCWLWWASQRRGPISVADRASVVFAMLASGLSDVSYDFYTVFHFGERDFDSFFEMGDGAEVVREVVKRVRASANPTALEQLKKCGWDDPKYAATDLFMQAEPAR